MNVPTINTITTTNRGCVATELSETPPAFIVLRRRAGIQPGNEYQVLGRANRQSGTKSNLKKLILLK